MFLRFLSRGYRSHVFPAGIRISICCIKPNPAQVVIEPSVALTWMITVVKEAAAWNSDSYACNAQVIDAWRQPPCFSTFAGNAALLLTWKILLSGLDFRVLEILHKLKLWNSLVIPTVLSEAHVSCNVDLKFEFVPRSKHSYKWRRVSAVQEIVAVCSENCTEYKYTVSKWVKWRVRDFSFSRLSCNEDSGRLE